MLGFLTWMIVMMAIYSFVLFCNLGNSNLYVRDPATRNGLVIPLLCELENSNKTEKTCNTILTIRSYL